MSFISWRLQTYPHSSAMIRCKEGEGENGCGVDGGERGLGVEWVEGGGEIGVEWVEGGERGLGVEWVRGGSGCRVGGGGGSGCRMDGGGSGEIWCEMEGKEEVMGG